MKALIITVVILLVAAGAWFAFGDQNDVATQTSTPSPSVSVSPSPTPSIIVSTSPTPSTSATRTPLGTPVPTATRTPLGTPVPVGTPFTSSNVRVFSPLPNSIINSPLMITGEARGNWYFEASFPIAILDGNGKEIARGVAQAQGDWMTTNFVPFKATITFVRPATNTGTLVFHKDNPSGLPQNDAQVSFPIRFR